MVAATNKNLQKEIEDGKFREDLYHRLSVIEIYVPPLDAKKGRHSAFGRTFCSNHCR